MKWNNTKENHFVDLTINEDGSFEWEQKNNCPDEPFLVAVETKTGWDIDYVVLTENGLEIFHEDGNSYYGWQITDVNYWCKTEEPFKK